MTDYGLIVKNNSNEIQIDSIYRNLSVSQSGSSETISNPFAYPGNVTYYTTISLTSSPLCPLILLRPNTDNFVTVMGYNQSGSNYIGANIVTEYDNGTTLIDWKCYRQNISGSGNDYGMLVYNNDGDLCFDSGLNYFKVYSTHSISLDVPPDQPYVTPQYGDYQDVTHSGISNPYYILSNRGQWFNAISNEIIGTVEGMWTVGVKKLSSTSVRVGWILYTWAHHYDYLRDVNAGFNQTMTLIVCDA